MCQSALILFSVLMALDSPKSEQETNLEKQILQNAHSHNDYLRKKPLHDAIQNGFCSVEADIFLVDGKLLVGHNRWSLRKGVTLERLYMEPLKELVDASETEFNNGIPFQLLIDIKKNGKEVYPVLDSLLKKYETMLTRIVDGKLRKSAIQIVISGDCPRQLIENDDNRLVAIDGRLTDLKSTHPSHLIPLISARWGSHFKWRGKSILSADELKKLNAIVSTAHKANRKVRFWATPESPIVWKQLVESKVDFINTDDLKKLREFFKNKKLISNWSFASRRAKLDQKNGTRKT